jgi:hypothetical protein
MRRLAANRDVVHDVEQDIMRDDLKAAFRSLQGSRTFTLVALTVLTLGIGASSAIFSVVDAVVLRGLPFDEHDRLVAVQGRTLSPDVDRMMTGLDHLF